MDRDKFDRLILEAESNRVSGWDWSGIGDRYLESATPWDYTALVQDRLVGVERFLDMGTGGGEWLAGLGDLPNETWATEAWAPNIPVARARLEPLGVRVVAAEEDSLDGLPDGFFDLVVNRHESFDAAEVQRVLRPSGLFVTQQVGGGDCFELNQALEGAVRLPYAEWGLELACSQLNGAGCEILDRRKVKMEASFEDIGAVVFYLSATPWQVEGFNVDGFRERLWEMHECIEKDGRFVATMERFLVVARKSQN